MKIHTPENLVEINTRIAHLKQLEEPLLKLASSGPEFKEGLIAILEKTLKMNDENIHSTLRQKLLPGEDPAGVYAELKALEGARICMEDLIKEVKNPQTYIDEISNRIANLQARKKEVEENLKQQDEA